MNQSILKKDSKNYPLVDEGEQDNIKKIVQRLRNAVAINSHDQLVSQIIFESSFKTYKNYSKVDLNSSEISIIQVLLAAYRDYKFINLKN